MPMMSPVTCEHGHSRSTDRLFFALHKFCPGIAISLGKFIAVNGLLGNGMIAAKP
jgi:hypothetical protein